MQDKKKLAKEVGKLKVEMTYAEDRNSVIEIAANILKLEDKYDSSMRGKFLNNLITEYVNQHCQRIIEMFDFIYTNQKTNTAYYNDDDITVSRISITGIDEKFDVITRGLLISDNAGFFDSAVIAEVNLKHKKYEGIERKFIHVRKVNREVESISVKKLENVDDNYVISYENLIDDEWNIMRQMDVTDFYIQFKMFMSIFHEIKYCIENEN